LAGFDRRTEEVMHKGIVYVQTRPVSLERESDYHRWYDETHLPEILAFDGFVAARRFEPIGDDGPFIAIYEMDAGDLEQVWAQVAEAASTGKMSALDLIQQDPPPRVRILREISCHSTLASAGAR